MSSDMYSQNRPQKTLIGASAALLFIFLAWAHFTALDFVTHGEGRVVPLGQNRTVQVPHRGTIVRFQVARGDRVEAGQVIAEINPTEAAGALAESEKRLRSLTHRLARLEAEMTGQTFEVGEIETDDEIEATLLAAEASSSVARRADLLARETALLQSRSQKERELEALQAELTGRKAQLDLLELEASQILPLVDAGVLGMDERFRLERDASMASTEISVLTENFSATEFSIAEIDAQITAARAAFQSAILEERVTVLSQIAELTERMPSLRLRVNETEVKAPITGVINQVFFDQEGAVVSEGDIIAEIVPETASLEVEVLIAPQDIANVEPGQRVRIALTAYDAAKYGTLDGTVLRVSADANMREEVQARMFVVETSIEGEITESNGDPVRVLPGMIAQVDIVRGERTVLEYFWNPVIKVRDRAFRE
jgi:adhesin transport system membrane fusion protein